MVAYSYRLADHFSRSRAEVEDELRSRSSKLAGFGVLHDAVAIFNGHHSTPAASGWFYGLYASTWLAFLAPSTTAAAWTREGFVRPAMY